MSKAFVSGGGKTPFPLKGNTIRSASGRGGAENAATVTFTIDPSKRYFINAAGTSDTTTPPGVGAELFFYNGNGTISTATSSWYANNSFTCTLSGTTLTVKNTLDSYTSSKNNYLKATLIPLDA